MNFELSEEQKMIQQSVERFVKKIMTSLIESKSALKILVIAKNTGALWLI
jgi:hypothetical protein